MSYYNGNDKDPWGIAVKAISFFLVFMFIMGMLGGPVRAEDNFDKDQVKALGIESAQPINGKCMTVEQRYKVADENGWTIVLDTESGHKQIWKQHTTGRFLFITEIDNQSCVHGYGKGQPSVTS